MCLSNSKNRFFILVTKSSSRTILKRFANTSVPSSVPQTTWSRTQLMPTANMSRSSLTWTLISIARSSSAPSATSLATWRTFNAIGTRLRLTASVWTLSMLTLNRTRLTSSWLGPFFLNHSLVSSLLLLKQVLLKVDALAAYTVALLPQRYLLKRGNPKYAMNRTHVLLISHHFITSFFTYKKESITVGSTLGELIVIVFFDLQKRFTLWLRTWNSHYLIRLAPAKGSCRPLSLFFLWMDAFK